MNPAGDTKIKVIFGSMFDQQVLNSSHVLVNPVNCKGTMGAGLAKQFAEAMPMILKPYKAACAAGSLRPGKPIMVPAGGLRPFHRRYVRLFPTKDDWRDKSRLEWIEEGLDWCLEQVLHSGCSFDTGPDAWTFPLLGAGLGGLGYKDVILSMNKKLRFADSSKFEPQIVVPWGEVDKLRRACYEIALEEDPCGNNFYKQALNQQAKE